MVKCKKQKTKDTTHDFCKYKYNIFSTGKSMDIESRFGVTTELGGWGVIT